MALIKFCAILVIIYLLVCAVLMAFVLHEANERERHRADALPYSQWPPKGNWHDETGRAYAAVSATRTEY